MKKYYLYQCGCHEYICSENKKILWIKVNKDKFDKTMGFVYTSDAYTPKERLLYKHMTQWHKVTLGDVLPQNAVFIQTIKKDKLKNFLFLEAL